MKTLALAFSMFSAVLLAPTGASARDSHRGNDRDRHHHYESDRRDYGYYRVTPCAPARSYENCRPDYRARWTVPYDCHRDVRHYRIGGLSIWIP